MFNFNLIIMKDELFYTMALTLVPNVGVVRAKKLISLCGSAYNTYKEVDVLKKIYKENSYIFEGLRNKEVLNRTEKEMDYIINNSVRVLTYLDENYPSKLRECEDCPIVLYVKGNVLPKMSKIISIVGTRKMTQYGRYMCNKIISELTINDIGIASGLAFGVDTAAHKFSLKHKIPTFAILGSGLKNIYPYQNNALANKILDEGCIITEFMSDTIPDKFNFPKRNRIIAGIADVVLVVESAEKGGSLITADIASSYSREVCAVPGRVTDFCSVGTNLLIKNQKAVVVHSGLDIIELMNWDNKLSYTKKPKMVLENFTEIEQQILKILIDKGECSLDDLILITKKSSGELSLHLLKLELSGLVKCLPGNNYILLQ